MDGHGVSDGAFAHRNLKTPVSIVFQDSAAFPIGHTFNFCFHYIIGCFLIRNRLLPAYTEPKVLDIPFSLEAAPSDNERVFVPMEPNAIHGLTLGEATVKDTPLGLSVRWLVSVTSEDVWDLVMKVEIDGVTYREGGFVQADDGNHYFQFAMGEGTIGDTMIVHFYDWDKQPIGDITFVKK